MSNNNKPILGLFGNGPYNFEPRPSDKDYTWASTTVSKLKPPTNDRILSHNRLNVLQPLYMEPLKTLHQKFLIQRGYFCELATVLYDTLSLSMIAREKKEILRIVVQFLEPSIFLFVRLPKPEIRLKTSDLQGGSSVAQELDNASHELVTDYSDATATISYFKYISKSTKSDEAHFWLNGYVNKQNCRIWSEANPQVYVETPLHPEKLTVWCAIWAGGILLQKR
ncbi:hypothetical protein TNCV_2820631 [Trichonephila clavipes]|nr:hypothetical protein TNCV_2820631 [Trichonephila clavipes]